MEDLRDVPEYAIQKMANPDKEYTDILKMNETRRWEGAIQAYLGTIAYLDFNVGRLIDAFEELPQDVQDNTIIVLWSDHGEFGQPPATGWNAKKTSVASFVLFLRNRFVFCCNPSLF